MPQSGQRVGEYELEKQLGCGTFGEVWLARHHAWSNRRVAVKIPTRPEYVRQLQREGAAIHDLDHPLIRPTPWRSIQLPIPPYLIMEYVPGVTLREVMRGERIPHQAAAAALRQILKALAHAHAHSVLHGDIKPENVLIVGKPAPGELGVSAVLKLTDFGLSRLLKKPGDKAASAQSILMSTSLDGVNAGKVSGTFAYMSPEQREGKPADARADMFACGVLLFEMLTGSRPAGTELPSDIVPSVPRCLDEVFRRSFARLELRVASAKELLQLLDASPAKSSRNSPILPGSRQEAAARPAPVVPARPPIMSSSALASELAESQHPGSLIEQTEKPEKLSLARPPAAFEELSRSREHPAARPAAEIGPVGRGVKAMPLPMGALPQFQGVTASDRQERRQGKRARKRARREAQLQTAAERHKVNEEPTWRKPQPIPGPPRRDVQAREDRDGQSQEASSSRRPFIAIPRTTSSACRGLLTWLPSKRRATRAVIWILGLTLLAASIGLFAVGASLLVNRLYQEICGWMFATANATRAWWGQYQRRVTYASLAIVASCIAIVPVYKSRDRLPTWLAVMPFFVIAGAIGLLAYWIGAEPFEKLFGILLIIGVASHLVIERKKKRQAR